MDAGAGCRRGVKLLYPRRLCAIRLGVSRPNCPGLYTPGPNWGGYAAKEPERIPETMQALFELHAAGKIRPVIYKNYPLEELPDALAALAGRRTIGKVIVTP